MSVRRFETAIGFVDWNTAVIASGAARRTRPDAVAATALEHVERIVSDYLESTSGPRHRVWLRLYAGWHAGTTRTDYFHGIDRIRRKYASGVRTYRDGRVAFIGGDDGIQFGARLACVSDRRLVRKHGVHLLDTLRRRSDGQSTEKMVDTALVSDLLGLALRKEADRYVVVSDDDDMLPGVFAAEAAGARVGMLRRPGTGSRFMTHAADLVTTYGSVEP